MVTRVGCGGDGAAGPAADAQGLVSVRSGVGPGTGPLRRPSLSERLSGVPTGQRAVRSAARALCDYGRTRGLRCGDLSSRSQHAAFAYAGGALEIGDRVAEPPFARIGPASRSSVCLDLRESETGDMLH